MQKVPKNLLFFIIFLPFLVQADGLCLNKDLFPVQSLNYNHNNIKTTADKLDIINKNKYSFSGKVIITHKNYRLNAENAILLKNNHQLFVKKNIKFQSPTALITANKGHITKEKQTLAKTRYQLRSSNIQGAAATITIVDKNILHLKSATYSTCPIGQETWKLQASEIILDKNQNDGTAYNVVLKMFEVPIFYLPMVSWALKGGKTGFLAPSFNSYNNGNESGSRLTQPFYVNLSNDKDLLLNYHNLSTRGDVIDAKYRQLFAKGNLEINGSFINNDKITKQKRSSLNTNLNYNLTPHLKVSINTHKVSDKTYLSDIQHQSHSITNLKSQFLLKYNEDDLLLSLLAEKKQIINTGSESYYRSPEIKFKKTIKNLSLEVIRTDFKHKDEAKITGVRRHSILQYQKNIVNPAYYLAMNLAVKNTNYELKQSDNQKRTLFETTLDGHLNFEKKFKNGIIHTLKPRIFYGFSQNKAQNTLPVFDTKLNSFSYQNLFSNNQFSGIDRISAANDWTLAIENTVIDTKMAEFEFNVAQKFYGDKQLNSTSTQTYRERKYSDIATKMSYDIDNYKFINDLRWDPEAKKIVKRKTSFVYKNNKQFIKLAQHKINEEDILEGYTGFNLNKNFKIIAGLNKSQTNNRIKKSALGLVYENCCWAMKLFYLKQFNSIVNNVDEFSKITQFELVFKGLGSTSPKTKDLIKTYIPDYD